MINWLLQFNSKRLEKTYARGIGVYLNKTFYYVLTLLIVGLTVQMIFRLLMYKANLLRGFFSWLPVILIEVVFFILVALCKRMGSRCVPYYRTITRAFDLFVLVGSLLFTLSILLNGSVVVGSIRGSYLLGYYASSFCWVISFIATGWIAKSITLVAVNCLITITFYLESDQNIEILMSGIVIICLGILFNYICEKYEKLSFLEKDKAYQQANCLREVLNDILNGIVIYSFKRGVVLYSNPVFSKFAFYDAEREFEENFSVLTIEREISHQLLNSTLGLPNQQTDALRFSGFREFFSSLKASPENAGAAPNDSPTKSRYIIQTQYNSGRTNGNKKFEIQILTQMYDNESVWVFIVRDTTEHDAIVALKGNNDYKNRLLASVSHELRTPLNCAITFTKQAIQYPGLPSSIRETCLKPVLSSCGILLSVVNDILDFSQIQQRKLKFVYQDKGLLETINECVDLLSIQAGMKGLLLTLETKLMAPKPIVRTDHNRVRQILLNLMSNALKFTYRGKITVSVTEKLSDDKENNKSYRSFEISVRDTGIGIKSDDQYKLFRAFEKIDIDDDVGINPSGVGLGLVISNNLARSLAPPSRMKPITFESEHGSGSTFTFEILDQKTLERSKSRIDTESNMLMPTTEADFIGTDSILSEDLDEGERVNSISLGVSRKWLTTEQIPVSCTCPPVLIVDDDIFNIYALKSILTQFKVSVQATYNGEEAIAACKARVKKLCGPECNFFKIIIMDCNMPVMDGYQASKELKEMMRRNELPYCPIIACTAFTKEFENSKATLVDMDDYISKPLVTSVLEEKLKKYNVSFQKRLIKI